MIMDDFYKGCSKIILVPSSKIILAPSSKTKRTFAWIIPWIIFQCFSWITYIVPV